MNQCGTDVFIGFGSNLGDRRAHINRAVELVDQLADTRVVALSAMYETQPRLYTDQPDFVNGCAQLRTDLSARALLDALLAIEQAIGRVRRTDNGPRRIDVDILLFGQRKINQPRLDIPHPGLAKRAFVLVPLAEIGADRVHPVLGKTIGELLTACTDAGWVRPYRNDDKKLSPTVQSTSK